jgi:hypothetical protein
MGNVYYAILVNEFSQQIIIIIIIAIIIYHSWS